MDDFFTAATATMRLLLSLFRKCVSCIVKEDERTLTTVLYFPVLFWKSEDETFRFPRST